MKRRMKLKVTLPTGEQRKLSVEIEDGAELQLHEGDYLQIDGVELESAPPKKPEVIPPQIGDAPVPPPARVPPVPPVAPAANLEPRGAPEILPAEDTPAPFTYEAEVPEKKRFWNPVRFSILAIAVAAF